MRSSLFFADAEDGVFCLVLEYLCASPLVKLVGTSASVAVRLDEGPSPSILKRRAIALGTAHFPLESQATTKQRYEASEALVALRTLASSRPLGKAVRLAIELAREVSEACGGRLAQEATVASKVRPFLNTLFDADLYRFRCAQSGCRVAAVDAAAETALASLLGTGECAPALLVASAAAIKEAEHFLDGLIDGAVQETSASWPSGYEAVARLRSAVEFLKSRLTTPRDLSGAAVELDKATVDLDETIRGYLIEGYNLSCPRLHGGVTSDRIAVPYSHWWLRQRL
jgi:hypothetical protein